jgi:hypothetical protein
MDEVLSDSVEGSVLDFERLVVAVRRFNERIRPKGGALAGGHEFVDYVGWRSGIIEIVNDLGAFITEVLGVLKLGRTT